MAITLRKDIDCIHSSKLFSGAGTSGIHITNAKQYVAVQDDRGRWSIEYHFYDHRTSTPTQQTQKLAANLILTEAVNVLARAEYNLMNGRHLVRTDRNAVENYVRHIREKGPEKEPDHILFILNNALKAGQWKPELLDYRRINARALRRVSRIAAGSKP